MIVTRTSILTAYVLCRDSTWAWCLLTQEMAGLGEALAVVTFADQCLKYGNKFVRRCKSYLHAEEEAVELLISIESNWLKMEMQIEILKKVADGLSKRLQDMQSQVLSLYLKESSKQPA